MATHLDEAVARIAEQHHGIFAVHHLDALGVTRAVRQRRIETGRWEIAYNCAYRIAGAPATWRSALLAGCWAGGVRALASHRSAAALWGLPSGRSGIVELTCPRWRRARHSGLVVHESVVIAEVDVATVTNIPCTSPARTLFDLARTSSRTMLDASIDSALRRRLVTLEALSEALQRLATQGRPGGRRFRSAVAERLPGAGIPESVPERRLSSLLVERGLPEPTAQYEVRTPAGEFVARVDLAYPQAMTLIEYDSFQEHTGKVALVRDSARRNALTELGYVVVVATASDLNDHARRLATTVRRLLARAA